MIEVAGSTRRPLTQKSYVTAILKTAKGVSVECWEIGELLPKSVPSTNRHCESAETPRSMQMSVGGGGVSGIEISTWPSGAQIFPSPPDQPESANSFAFGKKYVVLVPELLSSRRLTNKSLISPFYRSLFTLKSGLILAQTYSVSGNSIDDKDSDFYFDSANGDDWFYFEDDVSGNEHAQGYVKKFGLKSVSSSDSTLITFKHNSTPPHAVLHQGRCNFTGIRTVRVEGLGADLDLDYDRARMTVQDL